MFRPVAERDNFSQARLAISQCARLVDDKRPAPVYLFEPYKPVYETAADSEMARKKLGVALYFGSGRVQFYRN